MQSQTKREETVAMAKTDNTDYIVDLPIADKLEYSYQLTKDDVLSDDGLFLIQCMVRDGLTLDAIAKVLGIVPQTFFLWRKKHKELQDACMRGKQLVDYEVENALLKAALGYKTVNTKTLTSSEPDKDGNRAVKVERTETEQGPNVTACLAWLNNRKPEQWRRNRDNVLELEDKTNGITINIVKGQQKDDDWED